MTRTQILALSVVCCAFGALSLWGPEDYRRVALAVNVVTGMSLIFIAGRDLKLRGWQYGYLIGLTYLMPLVGLVTYLSLSDRPRSGSTDHAEAITS